MKLHSFYVVFEKENVATPPKKNQEIQNINHKSHKYLHYVTTTLEVAARWWFNRLKPNGYYIYIYMPPDVTYKNSVFWPLEFMCFS